VAIDRSRERPKNTAYGGGGGGGGVAGSRRGGSCICVYVCVVQVCLYVPVRIN